MYGTWDGSDLASQATVEDALEDTAQSLGLSRFFFVFEEGQEEAPSRVGVIDGSSNCLAKIYIGRRWFAVDPLLARARRGVTPFWGWESVCLQSAGQQAMYEHAAEAGFRTVVVVPALSPLQNVSGALYLGSERVVEPPMTLLTNAASLRTLAIDTLCWAVRSTYRRQIGSHCQFGDEELAALRCELMGYNVADTARYLQLTESRVEWLYRAVTRRLQTSSKRTAARLAMMAGVL